MRSIFFLIAGGIVSAFAETGAQLPEGYGRLPLRFELNQGQTDGSVRFLARGAGYAVFLTGDKAVMRLGDHNVTIRFEGARPHPRWRPSEPLAGEVNYITGGKRSNWRLGVPSYARVRLEGLYRGIDLVYHGDQRQLEFDWNVAPGADPSPIRIAVPDARLEIDTSGDLLVHRDDAVVRLHRPHVYQDDGSTIPCDWRLTGKGTAGLRLGEWDRAKLLVIDPTLSYSTYLGGLSTDIATGIALDANRNAYITGVTSSTNYPFFAAVQTANRGGRDAFVTKLSARGDTLMYSTYFGGTGDDGATAIAVDGQGNAYITGWTSSTNFPTVAAAKSTLTANVGPIAPSDIGVCFFACNAFVTKLDSNGRVAYSTYLGGPPNDAGTGIAVDSSGRAYVTGWTSSPTFGLKGAVQTSLRGALDAFVARFTADGALDFATYLGGSSTDWANAIAVDSNGAAYVTGRTNSNDFPTIKALQARYGGSGDAFVTKLDLSGPPSIVYSTYLGGSNADIGNGLAVSANGAVSVVGTTFSSDFPVTSSALQAQSPKSPWAASHDGGATWNAVTQGLPYSTIQSLAVDPSNSSVLYAGTTGAGLFKSTDGGMTWSAINNGLPSGSVLNVVIDPTQTAILYAGTSTGVYKSTDAGMSWLASRSGLPKFSDGTFEPVGGLALNPMSTSMLYAGTPDGLFISNDSGDSWHGTPLDFFYSVKNIVVDPVNPALVYATVSEYNFFSGFFYQDTVVKSQDGGVTWYEGVNNGIRGTGTTVLAIDPSQTSTLYLGTANGVYRSTDSAASWSATALKGDQAWALAIVPSQDPSVPSTVFAGTAVGIFKSADAGASWTPATNGVAMRFINSLVVDPANSSNVFAGGVIQSAAYATRLSASGAQMEFSTFLGGNGADNALAVALDSSGAAVVAGYTDSTNLPTVNPVQSANQGRSDAFVTQLTRDGSQLSFATYVGGSAADRARGVAVDSSGSIYLAGDTFSSDFPVASAFQKTPGDTKMLGDAFALKIAIAGGTGPVSEPSRAQPASGNSGQATGALHELPSTRANK